MKIIEALKNPATGVILSITPELLKRDDLVRVQVNEAYQEIIPAAEPVVELAPAVDEPAGPAATAVEQPKAKKGRK